MPKASIEQNVMEFAQTIGLFVRRVRAAAAAHDLSMTESSVMARLERHGPATIADLARAEGMKPQSMGSTVAALEQMGLLKRKPHPTDGRQVNIELSAKGAAVRKSVGEAKRTWLARAIGQLSDAERATVFEAGRIIKRLVEK